MEPQVAAELREKFEQTAEPIVFTLPDGTRLFAVPKVASKGTCYWKADSRKRKILVNGEELVCDVAVQVYVRGTKIKEEK